MKLLDLESYLILGIGLALAWFLEEFALPKLLKFTRIKEWNYGQIWLRALKGKLYCTIALFACYLIIKHIGLEPKAQIVANKAILSFIILLITAYIASVVGKSISHNSTSASGVIPSATILHNIAKVTLYLIGILVIINSMGVSITPLITALGIGGLAVSLALQETLSNLFSGIQILVSKQIRPGQFISLESSVKGYITDIGWRTTTLNDLQNNTIIIPNKNISAAIIKNFHLPDTETAVQIKLGVAYDSDLAFVEKTTIAVAKEVMREVEGGVPDFSPYIRINGFGDFAINFTAILRVKEYDNQFYVIHEFLKRLQAKYQECGITIPFPTRTIEVTNKEQASGKLESQYNL
jgi:small-conductance mechanosensitive channel